LAVLEIALVQPTLNGPFAMLRSALLPVTRAPFTCTHGLISVSSVYDVFKLLSV